MEQWIAQSGFRKRRHMFKTAFNKISDGSAENGSKLAKSQCRKTNERE